MMDSLPLPGNRVVFCLLLALVVSLFISRVLASFAVRIGLADPPGGRKRHEGTIPLTGGLGMFAGFFVGAMASAVVAGPNIALVVALFLLVFGGAADDMHDISAQSKLLVQLVAAMLMTSWAGVQVKQLGNLFGFGPLQLYDWSVPFSVVCAIGVINAINMVDGLDGAAGGISLTAALWLVYAALEQGLGLQAFLLLVLAAAIAGFLVWNVRFPPLREQARVFMGDSGSMMLGLALCWFSIDLTQGEGRSLAPIVCIWILAVPLLDMSRVMFVRYRRKVSMFNAGREHLHHVLLARGASPHAAALAMIGISVLCGGLALAAWRIGVPDAVLTYTFIGTFLAVLATAYVRERKDQQAAR